MNAKIEINEDTFIEIDDENILKKFQNKKYEK